MNGDLIKPIQECPNFDLIENYENKRKLKPPSNRQKLTHNNVQLFFVNATKNTYNVQYRDETGYHR